MDGGLGFSFGVGFGFGFVFGFGRDDGLETGGVAFDPELFDAEVQVGRGEDIFRDERATSRESGYPRE